MALGRLLGSGVTVVKCMLHISPEAQRERLLARLDDPAKRWKYNPSDVDVRERWAEGKRWEPSMDAETREREYAQWRRAVERSLDWLI